MTRDPEAILREVLAERAEGVTPPTGVYAAVRRRHRRRQQAVVGGTVAVAVAAVAVPTAALRDRPDRAPTATAASDARPTPAATTRPTPAPTTPAPSGLAVGEVCAGYRAPARPVPGLPAQSGVPGSLGSDAAVVTAVLRTGWAVLQRPESSSVPLDPATARVRLVQRSEDGTIVGMVGATGRGADSRSGGEAVVAGPTADRLTAMIATEAFLGAGAAGIPGGAIIRQVTSCPTVKLLVLAPPGSTAQVSWVTGIAADLEVETERVEVPLRPDGVGVIDRPAPDDTITIEVGKDGRRLAATWSGPTGGAGLTAPDAEAVAAAVAAAPGKGDRAKARTVLQHQFTQVPLEQSDLRVLWTGTTRSGWTVTAAVTTLPGGARYVWGGATRTGREGVRFFDGLLSAAEFGRTALAFRIPVAGNPLAVMFPGAGTVQLQRAGGTTTTAATGGIIAEDGAAVTRIRVLDANGRELRVVDAKQQLRKLPNPPG